MGGGGTQECGCSRNIRASDVLCRCGEYGLPEGGVKNEGKVLLWLPNKCPHRSDGNGLDSAYIILQGRRFCYVCAWLIQPLVIISLL